VLSIREIIVHIERMVPPRLAQEGDPIGLQVGDPALRAGRIMVALDASPFTVRQAVKGGAGLLVTHHPVLFRPLASIDPRSGTGEAVALALSHRLAIYSAHTNLDASPGGMNRSLASLLGLTGCRVLEASPARVFKVAVFVPVGAREKVREALFSGGAGEIGAYDRCSFAVGGEGTFRPGPGSRPALGRAGREARVAEARLEAVVEERALARVLSAVRAAHPYEEPAIDIFSLHATGREEGIGLAGELGNPVAASELVAALARPLSLAQVRMVGDMKKKVRRVAVCTGSGGSLLDAASRAGAELYITGDVGYHLARRAEEAGLALCDLGHYPPERFGMEQFARALGKALRAAGAAVEVVLAKEKDPFTLYFPPESAGGSSKTTRRKKQ